MGKISRELLTVPNAITAARLAASPYMARRLGEDPAGTWRSTAAFVASDIVDGAAAKLGDRFPFLAKIGLRRSEAGRLLDPFTDKITISQMVKVGMDNDIIPRKLAAAALAQKAAISAHSVYAMARGAKPEVSELGRKSELLGNLSMGFLFAAEGIEDPQLKTLARGVCITAGALGVAGALAADIGYVRSTHEQLAQQPVADNLV